MRACHHDGLVLVVANFVDLSAIASVGSAVSLIVFVLVGVAGWRQRRETRSNAHRRPRHRRDAIVLGFFAVDTLDTAPATFVAIVAIGALAVHLRRIGPPQPPVDAAQLGGWT